MVNFICQNIPKEQRRIDMKKTRFLALLLMLLAAFTVAAADGLPTEASEEVYKTLEFDVTDYAYEELLAIRKLVEDELLEQQIQYAKENGNRTITFESYNVVVYRQRSLKLNATVTRTLDSAPKYTQLVWKSSDPSVARVSENGTITGVAKGTAVITCSAKDDELICQMVTVNVVLPVTKVTLSSSTADLLVGGSASAKTLQLKASVEPADAYVQTCTWKSSNTNVAIVDQNGKVTAVGPGQATITATSNDPTVNGNAPKRNACTVTVRQAVTGITLNETSITLNKGYQRQLKATVNPTNATLRNVTWESSNPNVATVNSSGYVTAKAPGTVTITCSATDGSGVKATCRITVIQPVKSISINNGQTIGVQFNQTRTLTASVSPADASNKKVTWSSSDPSVATVDSKGKVTTKGYGTCTITATATDGTGVKGTVKLRVLSKYALELNNIRVSQNSIGSPLVYVTVENTSTDDGIIAFTFATRCWDAYGNLLKAHGFGDTTEYWIWQEGVIQPGRTWSSDYWRWTLYGFDTAYKIEVWLVEYRTSDGRTVTIPKNETQVLTWTKY